MQPGEQTGHQTADNDIMEMRNNKIRIMELEIGRRRGQHDPGDAPHRKSGNKADREQIGTRRPHLSAPHGEQPVEDFDPCR
ncbi:hypothetical protein D3C78_1881190 [compost metagenome]